MVYFRSVSQSANNLVVNFLFVVYNCRVSSPESKGKQNTTQVVNFWILMWVQGDTSACCDCSDNMDKDTVHEVDMIAAHSVKMRICTRSITSGINKTIPSNCGTCQRKPNTCAQTKQKRLMWWMIHIVLNS